MGVNACNVAEDIGPLGGSITVSILWITPFDALMSFVVMVASFLPLSVRVNSAKREQSFVLGNFVQRYL